MSFADTLVNGEQGAFKPATLTPMQKMILRFVVVGLVYYAFVAFLVVLGVSLHFVTYYTIPWKPMDMHRADIAPDKVFDIGVANHRFEMPAERLQVACNDKVRFNVTSRDLTYGFGLFRPDHSMLFQMQVVPGHRNDILWQFDKPGVYTIRSTEYSGPAGVNMVVKDAVVVSCD